MSEILKKLDHMNESVSRADLNTVKEWNNAFLTVHRTLRKAYTHSFGCSQNVADGEKINGLITAMGYELTDTLEEADFVLYNTCAVRETAEDRVLGHIGMLKNYKKAKPDMIIAVCGCMTQRPEIAEKLKKSYPYVDIVFGTGAVHRLPSFIASRIGGGKRVFWSRPAKEVVEGIPMVREEGRKASLTIMQGCDNFCSYCIVPHVRGREVSRKPEAVIKEARELINAGYREITLLGQNVNSYGKGLEDNVRFVELLKMVDEIPGDYRLRFMTSHPKDCTPALIDAIAESRHVCHHIHLPVQSGSDRILKEMNRRYTVEHYLSLIDYARKKIPDVTFSSDIIVGFPGETYEDFLGTFDLIKRVRYNALFTFIYSRRSGTPAATMPDPVPYKEKSKWFRMLLDEQINICTELNREFVGKTVRVLFDGDGKGENTIAGRTEGNIIVEVEAPKTMIGEFADVRITKAMNWAMAGELV